ncbi:ribosomal protein S17E [Catalinimonas alkaloidigena]|uniref:DUF6090 family protein n=1 Tax=Catalinimonas alkaloidigena TaxID=1075417 RepID=UPI00240504B1|nr:DUF6090 family protein [Catalinimonas alkaloidigena]MDF9798158.1 ribosomal protein S17E [Catalinimonas alkaloidigena]
MKFFRNIRRQLLRESRFGRYLLYAIGEIVLVVIGILIALSINNWNQRRIIREKEQFYLKALKSEFERNKDKLQNLMEVNQQNYKGAKTIAGMISEGVSPGEQELSQLLYHAFASEIVYNPNNSLLNEMISSGSLKDVSNAELRVYLTSWESVIDNLRRQEESLRQEREKMIDLLRTDAGSVRTIFDLSGISTQELDIPLSEQHYSNLSLLTSLAFENNLLLYISNSVSTEYVHYQPLVELIDHILQLIDREIEE